MRRRARGWMGALTVLLVVLPGLGLLGASSADAATPIQLRVSTSANRSAPRAVQHAILHGGTYVFVGPTSHVAKVSFWVDDTHRLRDPKRTDSAAPFDLLGGNASKAHPWWTSGLSEGTHHLTAMVTTTGGAHLVLQAVFSVHNRPGPPITPRTVAGNHTVDVFWHFRAGTTTGFNVYRSTSKPVSRTAPLNPTPLSVSHLSFVDTTAKNNVKYYYVVSAISAHGLLSLPSATVSARPLPPAPTPPPPPESVVATPGAGQIVIDWSSGGGTTSGFNVYRSKTSANVSLTNPLNGSTPLGAGTTNFPDSDVSTTGKYYYVVQAISPSGVRSDPSDVALANYGAAAIQLSSPKPVLYTQRNSGGVTGIVRVTNVGDADLTVDGASISSAPFLSLTPGSLPFTLVGGAHRDLTFSFNPNAHGPQHATVTVTSNDGTAALNVGGVAVDSTSTSEPSLQWIIDAYGIDANDGDPHPGTYQLDSPTMPPSGGVLVRGFTRRDSSLPIRVTALGAFVNPATAADPAKNPTWGWTPQNNSPGAATATYPGIRRDFIGTTYTINPSGTFGLWTRVEGATQRTDLNSSAQPRFIAFPVAGSPGTYVIANDTAGKTSDDWNDLPLLIENVNTIPPGTS